MVGILPRRFGVPHGAQVARAQVWVPMRFSEEERSWRNNNFLLVLGRLHDGATPAAGEAELVRLFDGIVAENPDLKGESVRVLPLQADGTRAVRAPLLLIFAAATIVLLIAAVNVASLLLARGVQRGREVAIRTALGGTRVQVMRPAMMETAVLTTVGLGLGIVLAWVGVRSIGDMAAQRLPQLAGLAINIRIVVFAMGLALLVALLAGLMPAWRGAAADPLDALRGGRGGGTGGAHHRLLGALVVAEVALSLVLLIGAGLVLRGFAGLWSRSRGSIRPASSPSRQRSRPTGIPTAAPCDATSSRRSRPPARCPGSRKPRPSRCSPTIAGGGTSASGTRVSRTTIPAGCRWWRIGSSPPTSG